MKTNTAVKMPIAAVATEPPPMRKLAHNEIPLLRGFGAGPPVRRFDMADIPDLGAWLYARVAAKRPQCNERIFPGWLRGWQMSNDFLLIRTTDAIGLFERYNLPLNPKPAVRDIFAYSRKDDNLLELEALYETFEHWAKAQGAAYVEAGNDSDFPAKHIKDVILCLRNRTVVCGDLSEDDE